MPHNRRCRAGTDEHTAPAHKIAPYHTQIIHTMEHTTIEWADATTYSRDDRNKIPTAWEYRTGLVRVYITHAHRYHPGKWVVICHEIGMNLATLKMPAPEKPEQSDIDAAQQTAIRVVKSKLQKMLSSFPTVTP